MAVIFDRVVGQVESASEATRDEEAQEQSAPSEGMDEATLRRMMRRVECLAERIRAT